MYMCYLSAHFLEKKVFQSTELKQSMQLESGPSDLLPQVLGVDF